MSKNILIIGGGISGLTALHYLKQKFNGQPGVNISLLEKDQRVGGTIRSIEQDGALFECGPNGFLDSKPSTLDLARELGLGQELISASPDIKTRYICVNDELQRLPEGLRSFFAFKPLSLAAKLRVAGELFQPKGRNTNETVYEFGTRRLGEGFAKYFLDPMVSGIFGGDARELNLKCAFPRIHEIEQTYGSLFKGMVALGIKKRRERQRNSLPAGQPAGQLWSFKKGMGQLTAVLAERYRGSIETGIEVKAISREQDQYVVSTAAKKYLADELILSVPAYAASGLVKGLDSSLSLELDRIEYAPVNVAGFLYQKKQFPGSISGFGYLRPTHEQREVLGTLFSSNIFSRRAPDGFQVLQVMIGGAKNPQIIRRTDAEILALAENELEKVLKVQGKPQSHVLVRVPRAIPQYNRTYPQVVQAINRKLGQVPKLHLLANYRGGVSVNDCTANARALADKILF